MARDDLDLEYRSALREAGVILGVFVVALVYTITFCYGFGHDVESIHLYWGIPDWVLWGIMVPWMACALFTGWFCFRFMKEDDDAAPASGPSVEDGERPDGE